MRPLRLFVAIASTLLAPAAMAYNFVPTEMEWISWPDYCKARYVTTNIGSSSKFARTVPNSQVQMWRRQLGDLYAYIHHYCAAIASTNRALSAPDARQRSHHLDYALDNAMFTFQRAPKSNPLFAKMAINLAVIETERGHFDEGVAYAQQAIDAHPKLAEPYCAMAQLYFKHKDKEKAREILRQGNAALEGKSAEVHYNLGLVELELGEVDAAVEHAKVAYSRGHPLPGLRRKLQQRGAWPDELSSP
jgi:tetratricopeptide (TPR) repeat protein